MMMNRVGAAISREVHKLVYSPVIRYFKAFLQIVALLALGVTPLLAEPQNQAPAEIASTIEIPSTINETEGPFSGVWTWNGSGYNATWNNGAIAIMAVSSFTPASVVINRVDTATSISAGLTAVYTGQISSASNTIVNGSVTWTWPGVAGYPAAGTWSASWSAAASNIAARISFTGGADITDTLQDAVVGQQIALTGSVLSLPAGVTVKTRAWHVQGTVVGGFQASSVSGQVQPTKFTKADTVFYWTAPSSNTAQKEAVTFMATLSDGSVATATATFNLVGPDSTAVTTTLGRVRILPPVGFLHLRQLSFGRLLKGDVGILQQASTNTPVNYDGTLLWVQVINKDTVDYEKGSETLTCESTPGIDLTYPYVVGAVMDDSPSIALIGITFEPNTISRVFAARTYLMWDPLLPSGCMAPKKPNGDTTCSSIPVPLGYVDWGFAAKATRIGRNAWAPSGGPDPTTLEFVESLDFPYWTTPEKGAPGPCPQ